MTQKDYKEVAAAKVAERDAKLVKEWLVPEDQLPGEEIKDVLYFPPTVLSSEEVEITESDAATILAKIKSKEWTALQVAKAFGHRATIAHQLTNCLTEVFFEEGLAQAKELDEYYEKTGELKGALHGLPISIKDDSNIKNVVSSIGITGLSDNVADEDSVQIRLLRELGAVFMFKTNLPTGVMMPETYNHLYGRTLNPLNRDLSAGGSSGGECALLALRGAPIGVGSDIGGSMRIPSSAENLFTIRPSFGRFPTYGTTSSMPGLESVNSVVGPISTSMDSLELYYKSILSKEPWFRDGKVVEIPWREVELPEKLTFGVYKTDGVVQPHPGVIRGLNKVIDSLKKQGHEIIEWETPEHKQLFDFTTTMFSSNGSNHMKKMLAKTNEPFFPQQQVFKDGVDIGVEELWNLQAERTNLLQSHMERWNATAKLTHNGKPVDGLIGPVTPYNGVPHAQFKYSGYTRAYNGLDLPCGVVPVARADKSIDLKDETYTPKNELDKAIYESYDPEVVHGGAIAVQVIGRRFQEEKVLKMMRVVAKAVGTEDYWKK